MDNTPNTLFEYLRKAIYDPENASLNVDDLPEQFHDFAEGLKYYVQCVSETSSFAAALSKGTLDGSIPSRGNEIAAPLKSLHASLRHLTWQAQRIALGDYNQRVAFMGDFADAFNKMVTQLAEREQSLEDKIKQIEEKTSSLEQSNLLLIKLIHYIPQQIFVINRCTRKVLLTNDIALNEVNKFPGYLEKIIELMSGCDDSDNSDNINEFDIMFEHGGIKRFFIINKFFLEWLTEDAEVYMIHDVSETRREIADLETHAYRDELTNLYNRAYGMMTLDLWLHEKKRFILVFVDLDRLKYINDIHGHREGDVYIIRAGEHLKAFSDDSVVCRIGGDEFMLLAPDLGFDTAFHKMNDLVVNLRNDEYQHDKDYVYNMSFGIAAVDVDNKMSAADILAAADLRMYEDKQRNKRKMKLS